MEDRILTKPTSVVGYQGHRLVAALLPGQRVQFVDRGDHILLRTESELQGTGAVAWRPFAAGSILGFTLRASVGRKVKGRHRYWPTNDWRSRHAWLGRKASQHGFEVISVHCTAQMLRIESSDRSFTIDQTDFTGVLKVIDAQHLERALRTGIGSVGRAFGMGMLCL